MEVHVSIDALEALGHLELEFQTVELPEIGAGTKNTVFLTTPELSF